MGTNDIDEALEYLLEEEGGWSNHPADRGGATKYGVTQTTFNSWRKKKGRRTESVANLTQDEARDIYREEYWDAAGCDRLPWPVSYITFDAAVNSGVSRAIQWTQEGLGMQADRLVGAKTVSAANRAVDSGDAAALFRILDRRVQFLARLIQKKQDQSVFLLGWWRRTMRVLARSLTS